MIAFDLQCAQGHVFEAWFRSSADYDAQAAGGLLICAQCGIAEVRKAAMAPHVGRKGNQGSVVRPQPTEAPSALPTATPPSPAAAAPPQEVMMMMAAVAAAQAEALPRSTWVGRNFAARARAMHDGAEETALIHGQASPAEAEALAEDGIGVMPLLVPIVPPEKQN